MPSSFTSQPTARIRTPALRARSSASANSGWVRTLGMKRVIPSICTTKRRTAPHPSFFASISSSTCFTARSDGASGNRATLSCSRLTPFTSIQISSSGISAGTSAGISAGTSACASAPARTRTRKSNRDFPKVHSGRTSVTSGYRPPALSHSSAALFGAVLSMLTSLPPFLTVTRS